MALDDRTTYSFDRPRLARCQKDDKISYASVLARGCERSVKTDMRKPSISYVHIDSHKIIYLLF